MGRKGEKTSKDGKVKLKKTGGWKWVEREKQEGNARDNEEERRNEVK